MIHNNHNNDNNNNNNNNNNDNNNNCINDSKIIQINVAHLPYGYVQLCFSSKYRSKDYV